MSVRIGLWIMRRRGRHWLVPVNVDGLRVNQLVHAQSEEQEHDREVVCVRERVDGNRSNGDERVALEVVGRWSAQVREAPHAREGVAANEHLKWKQEKDDLRGAMH